MIRFTSVRLLIICLSFWGSSPALAKPDAAVAAPQSQPASQSNTPVTMTPVPDDVIVKEQVGVKLNLDLPVRDDDGRTVPLRNFFNGDGPKILIPVYYGCPLLCTVTLNRFIDAFQDVPYQPGEDVEILAFSIDPRENHELASEKKAIYLKAYPATASGWHFLTAHPKTIRTVTDTIGFGYRYDPKSMEYLHRAAVVFLSSQGEVIRYLHGSDFKSAAIRLALLEAGGPSFGSAKDRLVASLFKYDTPSQRYVPNLVTVILALGLVFFAFGSITWMGIRWLRRRSVAR